MSLEVLPSIFWKFIKDWCQFFKCLVDEYTVNSINFRKLCLHGCYLFISSDPSQYAGCWIFKISSGITEFPFVIFLLKKKKNAQAQLTRVGQWGTLYPFKFVFCPRQFLIETAIFRLSPKAARTPFSLFTEGCFYWSDGSSRWFHTFDVYSFLSQSNMVSYQNLQK